MLVPQTELCKTWPELWLTLPSQLQLWADPVSPSCTISCMTSLQLILQHTFRFSLADTYAKKLLAMQFKRANDTVVFASAGPGKIN